VAGDNATSHKDKGDVGVACVIADLVKHDIQVATLISEHLPFDLIAIHSLGELVKLSVKYRETNKQGTVHVRACSSWNDRHGAHNRPHNPGDYDAVAIYCPDTDACYYLRSNELSPDTRTLRIRPAANTQIIGVRMAHSFCGPDRLFGSAPVAQWIEHLSSKQGVEGSIPSGGAGSQT
jgi:PD-(D/E)XK nuclease superfamily protein